MILSDSEILNNIALKNIVIEPFESNNLGSNSYDVRLGETMKVYKEHTLDAKIKNETVTITIPEEGFVLQPGELYLASTVEYTESHIHVPFLEGKSSIGRLGINIHATAGKGDLGFCNHWTMEISCIKPVRVYANMLIGQLIFFCVSGVVRTAYGNKKGAKYVHHSTEPVASKMHENFK